jgi:hypothetical protein
MDTKFGPQCLSDNSFTSKVRKSHSRYRVEVLKETDFGNGPNKSSPSKYGNILVDGEMSGKNFLLPEIFLYAKERVENKKGHETIDVYRLFNNMISSMPMCFNLFYPLKCMLADDEETVTVIFQRVFSLPIRKVTAIEIEYVPNPIGHYLNDKSAMDAAIFYNDYDGNECIIAIETKYVEKLGANPPANSQLHSITAEELGMFNAKGLQKVKESCSQIYRNFLLVEKFRLRNSLKESYTVILSPEENPYTASEVSNFKEYILPEYHYKIKHVSLEQFVDVLLNNSKGEWKDWAIAFEQRYLAYGF